MTSALFRDFDGDGDPDLVVACEWGPIHLFTNEGGRLRRATAEAGLADRTGWWNGLVAGDVDNDGDLDLVATNAGRNTKYRASADHAALLYFGDLDGTGALRIVEAKEADELLPVRGLSCSSHAMPSLGERIPTYDLFARSTLEEIYTPECLAEAGRLEANELETGLWINESTPEQPRFRWQQLPRLVQAAPSFGAVLEDFDGDGDLDLFLAQNFFHREPETGRWDGGVGALLLGDGSGAFTWVEPVDSGVVVPGEATAATSCDTNEDGRPDLLVACREGPLRLFENASEASQVALRIAGEAGNPQAVGARVRALSGPAAGMVREIGAGSGAHGHGSPRVHFAMPSEGPLEVEVRWPDGPRTRHEIPASSTVVSLERPGETR